MKKILKVLSNPGYTIFLLSRKLRFEIYSGSKEIRSDSDDGHYLYAISKALKNQRKFDRFKRLHAYRAILEHVTKEQGSDYLHILERRKDDVLRIGLDTITNIDGIGKPVKYYYDAYATVFSPTTLRYLKVASDLKSLFGNDLGRVAEIGCGYGGQALVNDSVLNVTSAKLFDLPLVNQLIDRYINSFVLNGSYTTTVINREDPQEYDLVISNYAFSELPRNLQLIYIKKVLAKSKRGYLIMNSGIGGPHSTGKLTLDELRELLPEFILLKEEPSTAPHNYLIVWGHFQDVVGKEFTTL